MIKRIGILLAALAAAFALTTTSAHAATSDTDLCSTDAQPAPISRVQVGHDGQVTTKVLVTRTLSVCNPSVGTWIVVSQHVREWKRYSRDSGARACQMWARSSSARSSMDWSRWHNVPWANATNC